MGVYKLSTAGGLATPRTNYSSFLAGNPAVVFGSYESIQTVTVGTATSTMTFTSIPSTYTHLQIRGMLNGTAAGTYNNVRMGFNSDGGANYSSHVLYGDGGTAAGFQKQAELVCTDRF